MRKSLILMLKILKLTKLKSNHNVQTEGRKKGSVLLLCLMYFYYSLTTGIRVKELHYRYILL